ncbi:uncharacterized protein B0P05DRAFT_566727 [Gilbertella persicaria]|uniref:uncharacterized protein n=1 Tax=Gilbertella persicaria TaxID=101096 RepID=UPI002220E1AF|nr:uncharacterized protein B0P05DRAFT_566727 [Gilbertella persicaria]KAI8047159.1 hypothetical protein B0P05DRAFT_566727 [Gilbertella persicaria]
MNILQNRIDSFQNYASHWPHKDPKYTIETFAKAGFYHVRRQRAAADSVRCFMCDIELSQWTSGRSPYARHAKESPSCPWTILHYPDTPGSNKELQPHTKVDHARLETFQRHHYWPPPKGRHGRSRKYPSAIKLAEAGFYFAPTREHTARIKCPFCQVIITEPDQETNPWEKHKELKSDCIFFSKKNKRDSHDSVEAQENEQATQHLKKRRTKNGSQISKSFDSDSSMWDINRAFESTPPHIKKPAITFGKPVKRRLLPSDKLKPTVDIFSNALGQSDTTRQPVEMKKQEQLVPSQPSMDVYEPTLPKKDKGKGRAIESPAAMTAATTGQKRISLSKSKPTFTTNRRRLSLHHDNNEEDDLYFSGTLSPENKHVFLQSTPMRSGQNTVSAADIFGDCPYSPIFASHHPQNSTPQIERTHSMRAFSPPRSPTHSTSIPILSMPQLPSEFTPEQKKLTVEQFLQQTIQGNIHRVKERGAQVIQMIQKKSNQLKMELLQQKQKQ